MSSMGRKPPIVQLPMLHDKNTDEMTGCMDVMLDPSPWPNIPEKKLFVVPGLIFIRFNRPCSIDNIV